MATVISRIPARTPVLADQKEAGAYIAFGYHCLPFRCGPDAGPGPALRKEKPAGPGTSRSSRRCAPGGKGSIDGRVNRGVALRGKENHHERPRSRTLHQPKRAAARASSCWMLKAAMLPPSASRIPGLGHVHFGRQWAGQILLVNVAIGGRREGRFACLGDAVRGVLGLGGRHVAASVPLRQCSR